MRSIRPSAVALAMLAVSSVAFAGGLNRALFTNIQTSDTSLIPGDGGLRFRTGTTSQFDRVFVSENGQHWLFRALAASPATTSNDELLVAGQFASSTGAYIAVREGNATGFDGFTFGTIRQQSGINNAGVYAFSADTTNANTGSDDVVVRGANGVNTLMAREGTAVPGSGFFYGPTNDGVGITNFGEVLFRSFVFTGSVPSTSGLVRITDPLTGSVFAQTLATVPLNQLVAPNQALNGLNGATLRVNGSGSRTIHSASLLGPTSSDLVTIVNNSIAAQEGAILPGSTFTSNVSSMDTAAGTRQISDAYAIFRGTNVDTIDWVSMNGAVVAATDTPIYNGASETFDDTSFAATFFLNAVSALGDYVVGGVTSNPNTASNAALIFSGGFEVAREGDPVDVNGDGLFNDNAFLSVFNNDDCGLTFDGKFYFMADLRDSAQLTIGQAVIVTQVGVQPSAINLVEGSQLGGTLRSFEFADDNRYLIICDENQASATLEMTATAPLASAATMRLMFETISTRDDQSVFVEVFNYSTNDWVQAHFEVSATSDSFVSTTAPGLGTDYIRSGDRQMKARIVWVPSQDLDSGDGWSNGVDLFSFIPMQ